MTNQQLKRMKRLRPVMFAGTGSDVGKSVLAAGFCRIFRQDGYSPAPFKAQNMALNSFVTPEGLEIGRAQAVQAEACGIAPCADMNPILLKPLGDSISQIVLNGRAVTNVHARDYYEDSRRDMLRAEVCNAFDRLAAAHSPVVIEGAGSVAELNLRDADIVNISMARHAGAAVILVADIERGGVFASAYGSVMLQQPEDRRLIKGIIVNKFRGDATLFDNGRKILENICGVPVLGVVPYFDNIHIEEEDSMELAAKKQHATTGSKVNVAVVKLSHISNFTDFDMLEHDARVNLYYCDDAHELDSADIIILPGIPDQPTVVPPAAEILHGPVVHPRIVVGQHGFEINLRLCDVQEGFLPRHRPGLGRIEHVVGRGGDFGHQLSRRTQCRKRLHSHHGCIIC